MSYNPDHIIKVATELKEARDRVNQLEAELKSIVDGTVPLFSLRKTSPPQKKLSVCWTLTRRKHSHLVTFIKRLAETRRIYAL